MKNKKQQPLMYLGIGVFAAALLLTAATTTTSPAFAQQQTPSTAAQQIIETTKAECASQINLGQDTPAEVQTVLAESCISLVHESPTMIVLNGDLLISTSPGLYSENTSLWKAVNMIKDAGYNTITSVELAGQGNQGNPHKLYVVMTK
jgi:hypothetical protein